MKKKASKVGAKKKSATPVKRKSVRETGARSMNKVQSVKKKDSVQFSAILEVRKHVGGGHFVRVPAEVTAFFGKKGRTRVLGTMNGVQIDRALIPNGEGGHEIIIGTDVRKKTKAEPGSKVVFDIWRNPNPDEVEIPEELLAAIELEPIAVAKFAKMTPGMKRNMAYWVDSGKLPETRAKRAVEILNRIMNGSVFGGRKIE